MSTQVTKQDLQQLSGDIDQKIDKAVTDLSEVMQSFMQQVSDRFDEVDRRFEKVYDRFDEAGSRMDRIEDRIDRLTNTIDHFIKRLDDQEAELAARDYKIAKLEKYIEVLADKAGVDLSTIKY